MSNNKVYRNMFPLNRILVKERLRWLGWVLRIKNDRLPKKECFLAVEPAQQKARRPGIGRGGASRKDSKEVGTSRMDVKIETLNRLDWLRRVVIHLFQNTFNFSSSDFLIYVFWLVLLLF